MHCPLNQPLILPFCEEKKKSAGTKVDLLQKCGVTLKDIAIGLEVTSVPLCFLLRKKHQTRDQLQQLVSDTIDEVLDTPLRSEFIPSTVVSALASMACHGSVRFGRKMSRDSCLQLIRLLSAQKLPFQCAHGRPSLVPLIKIPTIAKFLLSKPVKNLVARKKKFNA
ncbi:DNA mismatch repair protein Mlh3-like [Artemia franciscana]|uniref:DNA mismatch repair protein Mlh3-like n=1 Tax=Artemia franciscana TaxID=6661 RepID=UPI0032DA3EA3